MPRVTLVGVISADTGLGVQDFRAAERTFQLLTQVAGRAGRGELSGKVIIQTLNPEHYAVTMAAAQDYECFYRRELAFRNDLRYPPFSAMASILVRSENQDQALKLSAELAVLFRVPPKGLYVKGPVEAPVSRLKAEYRYQMLLKSSSRKTLRDSVEQIRQHAVNAKWPATALVVDVDPLNLM
jgi:primosomal protein N' (replication factor Y) (superfamily II helicase)